MTVIVDIDHEDGTLSEYYFAATDGGDLSVEAGAALAGTNYGLQAVIDDTVSIYGRYDVTNSSGVFRIRFYFDPNTITMANSDRFQICEIYNGVTEIARIEFYYQSAYQIRARCINDASATLDTNYYTITDDPHYIAFKYIRATDAGSSDGSLQLWINGVDKQTLSSIDNYDRFPQLDRFLFGHVTSIVATETNGTVFFDEMKANDDGSEIGPLAPSTLSASTSDGLTLGESMHSVASLGNIDVALDNANYQGRGVRII